MLLDNILNESSFIYGESAIMDGDIIPCYLGENCNVELMNDLTESKLNFDSEVISYEIIDRLHESYNDRILSESVVDKIKGLWVKFVNWVKGIVAKIKGWFTSSDKKDKDIEKTAEEVSKKVDTLDFDKVEKDAEENGSVDQTEEDTDDLPEDKEEPKEEPKTQKKPKKEKPKAPKPKATKPKYTSLYMTYYPELESTAPVGKAIKAANGYAVQLEPIIKDLEAKFANNAQIDVDEYKARIKKISDNAYGDTALRNVDIGKKCIMKKLPINNKNVKSVKDTLKRTLEISKSVKGEISKVTSQVEKCTANLKMHKDINDNSSKTLSVLIYALRTKVDIYGFKLTHYLTDYKALCDSQISHMSKRLEQAVERVEA